MYYLEYVESIAKTNKLYCTKCKEKIKQGSDVVFGLNEDRKMEEVFHSQCASDKDVYEEHPFSSNALGQE